MNTLGHPYVAYKVFGRMNKFIAAGSFINDLVPFVPDSVFDFQEIHEGGEKLLGYLGQKHPEKKDLALAMLAHGTTYGADKFSKDLEIKYESYRKELVALIMQATPNLAYDVVSKYRFHNFLWWGIDAHILESEPKFVNDLGVNLNSIEVEEVSELLAECFHKKTRDVVRMLNFLLDSFNSENLASINGLATIWKNVARGLPEKDDVNIQKTSEVFRFCATIVQDDWKTILADVIYEVRTNLSKFEKF